MKQKYLHIVISKIMTAVVALENSKLTKEVITNNIVKEVYGSMIYAKENEKFTIEDLLYGLMLRSGNDAAMLIADNTLGYEKFINKMNETATKIGMNNTVFQNPHGLDDETKNYSSSYDLALLMQYAMTNSEFKKITNTKKYLVETNMNNHIWYNKNKLLSNYKYATGGKIGYTEKSKHVFVSSATKNKKKLIIATIKDTDRFNTHETLYEEFFSKYERYKILDKYTFSINDNKYKDYYMYIKNDFYMLLKTNEKEKVYMEILLNQKINKNIIGSVNVYLDNILIHKEILYAIKKSTKITKMKNLLYFWK